MNKRNKKKRTTGISNSKNETGGSAGEQAKQMLGEDIKLDFGACYI
jgi:hypothetical protein